LTNINGNFRLPFVLTRNIIESTYPDPNPTYTIKDMNAVTQSNSVALDTCTENIEKQ